jgi:hypothetical protein
MQESRNGFFAVVGIVRNEARYLPEWVAFHLLSGADHMYIYDNDSSDNTKFALSRFISEGFVTVIDWKHSWFVAGKLDAQHAAYADAIIRFGQEWRWMAFLDADEFLFAVGEGGGNLSHLRTLLESLNAYPVLTAWWTMFGSNGHQQDPNGLVIENFPLHAPFPLLSAPKVICDPLAVKRIWSVHMFDTVLGQGVAFDERGRVVRLLGKRFWPSSSPYSNTLRLHHYYVRSHEDAKKKVRRRREHWSEAKVGKLEQRLIELEKAPRVAVSSAAAFIEPLRDLI